jgi:hypothetical protein
VIDANDLGHLLEAVDVSVDARKEVPDANRAAGLGDRSRIAGADLPTPKRRPPAILVRPCATAATALSPP